MPNPPPNFLPRLEDLEALKAKLLNVQRSVVMTGSSAGVTVQGMGGLGKSVLAASVAHDAEVQRAFPNGVFWLTVGQEAKLLELQTELAKAVLGDSTDRQPDFSTVPQGQTYLRSLLADKACLLVLDDIWQVTALAALNCIGARGQLLVTTRDARITTSIGATEYQLELLSNPQARRLLAQWTQIPETVLPPEADAVVAECGALPLALAMTGAMLRGKPDRWSNVLHKLRSADLEKIKQQFPDYPYPDLLKAIAISVDALDPDLRQRYLDFALFPEDTPIPEAVLQTFWEPEGLDKYDTQDAIDELANLSLLRRDDQGRVTLHDLQVDFVRKQVGAGLPQLHERWLAAYRELCPQGWHELVNDGYCFEGLAYHLVGAGCEEKLRSLLLDFRWLQARLRETTINGLLSDYELLPEDQTLVLVRNSLRLSAHVFAIEKGQLAGRLLGHLLGREQPEIQALLTQAEQPQSISGLRPLHANLAPPDGALLRTLVGHSAGVLSVAVLPDSKRALSASVDHTLKLWDLEQGVALQTLEGHSAGVLSVAVLPDGKRALSASVDHTLKLWDLEQGIALQTLEGHNAGVLSVAVLPDGKRALSSSSDGTLKLWDLEAGVVLQTLEGCGRVYGMLRRVLFVAVLLDGKRALSGSGDGTLKLWDLEAGVMLQTLKGHSDRVNSVTMLLNGKRALSGSGNGTLKLWDLEAGVMLQTLKGHSNSINSVTMLLDGKRALSGSGNGILKLWDLEAGVILQTLKGHSGIVMSVTVLPDGNRAISGSGDGTLKLWDLEAGVVLQTLEAHRAWVCHVALLPDSKRVLSASHDRTLKLWDLSTGTLITSFTSDRPFDCCAIAPDGKTVVAGDRAGKVHFFSIES